MTRITYDREELRLEMEGHAGAGPKGADPVCAALSMLMLTLAARMREREEETLPAVSQAPGRFMICCRPEEGEAALCRESFDTVAAGIAVLAENRPENITLTLTGEEAEEEDEE